MPFLLVLKNSNMASPFVQMDQDAAATKSPVLLTMDHIATTHMTKEVTMVNLWIPFVKGTNPLFACDAEPLVTGPAIAQPPHLTGQTIQSFVP